jgi:hypothetical protein
VWPCEAGMVSMLYGKHNTFELYWEHHGTNEVGRGEWKREMTQQFSSLKRLFFLRHACSHLTWARAFQALKFIIHSLFFIILSSFFMIIDYYLSCVAIPHHWGYAIQC